MLVGLYVLLLFAFVQWFGPSIRERPAASDPVLAVLHDHVAIRVADDDETLRWYSDKLGFHVGPQWSDGELRFAYLISGSAKIEVIGGGRPERLVEAEDLDSSFGVQGYDHFCLAVDDLGAVVAELRRRGVTIVREPFPLSAINRRLASRSTRSWPLCRVEGAEPAIVRAPRLCSHRGIIPICRRNRVPDTDDAEN